MIRIFNIVFLSATLLFLAGCSRGYDFSNAHPQLVAEPDRVSSLLADAADRATTALETLAAVEYSRTPGVAVAPIGNAPPELRRAVTVNWVGPVEQITQKMANRAEYNFTVIGSPPPVPIVISIDIENKPVIDVLRDIGLQLGLRADLKIDGPARVVEIHYPPNAGIGG